MKVSAFKPPLTASGKTLPHNQPVQFQELLRGAAEIIQATGCAFFGLLFKLIL
jgi:hypothetical protein